MQRSPAGFRLLFAALAACSDVDPGPRDVGPEATTGEADTGPEAHAWQTFEAAIDHPVAADNPFDPDRVELDASFRAPDGTTWDMPGFVYQGYERTLEAGRERLRPKGAREWRVRFRPPFGSPAGTWSWRWRARTPDGEQTSGWRDFTPAPAGEHGSHGLVRRSARDHRYLVFEDGAPFFAIGENMGWADGRGTYAYDDWMGKLAQHGGNYIRVWMPSWGFGLEWIERDAAGALTGSSLGDYSARLDRAWQLDHVLARAEGLGVQVMLTILNHGPYSFVHATQWDDNPYNAANGGPLAMPSEVFTDPTARKLHRRLLRYLVARWGHASNILAWELWNEVDLVADPATAEVKAWTREMAGELARLDPYDHLVTTSIGGIDTLVALVTDDVGSLPARFDFWSAPEIDLTQLHFYGIGTTRVDFSTDVAELASYLHSFHKPVLVAEAGVNAFGPAETLADDPGGVAFHDILWAGLFAETFGTGMSWWWDEINDPHDYYPRFGPLAELVRDVRFDEQGFVRGDAQASAADLELVAHVLRGTTTTLSWIKNPRHQWYGGDLTTLGDGVVAIAGLPAGRWRVRWVDPYSERTTVAAEAERAAGDDPLRLAIPVFARDIALRLDFIEAR